MLQKNTSVDDRMSVDELIFFNSKEYPQKIAYESDEVKISYEQLDLLSWSFANFYLSKQVQPSEVIALSIRNDLVYLIAMLGAMKIGVTLFGIPVSEPTTSRLEELARLKITKCFSDFRSESDYEWIKIPIELTSIKSSQVKVPSPDRIDKAWMALTSSGSTGARKIFFLTHRQQLIRSQISNGIHRLTDSDKISTMSPLCYPAIKQRYLEALLIGATIVKLKEFGKVNALADHQVTVLFATSMHAEQLLREISASNRSLEKLRDVVIGGAEVKNLLRERIVSEIGCNLIVRYACNETSLISSTSRGNLAIPFSVGTPAAGVQVKIINAAGTECDVGIDGYILVKTAGMIASYLNEEDTKKNFIDGWFVTGDIGNLNSQKILMHKGRRDGVVIFNGINISLAEITKTALSFDFVSDAVSISLSHPIHQDIPVCVVQFNASSSSMLGRFESEIRNKMGSRGPKIAFEVDSIPRDKNGKLVIDNLRTLLGKLMAK